MRKLLWNLMVLLMVGTVARAELLVYEGFDGYTVGAIKGQVTSGTGLSGAWGVVNDTGSVTGLPTNTVVANSLAYPTGSSLTTTGGAFYKGENTSAVSTAIVPMSTTINFGADATYYISFLFRQNNSVSGSSMAWLKFTSGIQSGWTGTVMMGSNNVPTQSFAQIAGVSNFTTGPVELSNGDQVYLFTAKLTTSASGNDTLSTKIYTTNPAEEPTTWTTNLSSTSSAIVDYMAIAVNSQGRSLSMDEIRVGTTWEDVVGTQIPEPATMLLSAGALSSLLLRKKK